LDADVIQLSAVDKAQGWLYFLASPDNATQRYLYRSRLDGTGAPERVTPSDAPGTHGYDVSPNGRLAFHTYSRFDQPPATDVVDLPAHTSLRTLTDTSALVAVLAPVVTPPVEFFKVDIEGDVDLDGWILKPSTFDPSKKYPVIVYVYGEPAGQTVVDRWGGGRNLFHRALAEAGYLVLSIDNRGTPAPKGAAWRKIIYGTVGDLSSKEQAAAIRALAAKYPYIDRARIGVWGWSGGGSNTLNTMFRFPDVFSVGVSVAPMPVVPLRARRTHVVMKRVRVGRDAGTEVGLPLVPGARCLVGPGVPRAPRIPIATCVHPCAIAISDRRRLGPRAYPARLRVGVTLGV
jgi:dipeptidyl-peptidase-4